MRILTEEPEEPEEPEVAIIRGVRRHLLVLSLLVVSLLVFARCAAPPPPVAAPSTPAPPLPSEQTVIGTVHVTASALNVRESASTDSAVVTQVKRGATLSVLSRDESWTRVRLASGETGWVASRFVSDGSKPSRQTASRKGCPADSDFAFLETPTLAFSESGAHGLVVVEANVNAKGTVSGTKLISNSTGDEALAFLAEREIKSAKFSAPIRNCSARAFIFTYRRTF